MEPSPVNSGGPQTKLGVAGFTFIKGISNNSYDLLHLSRGLQIFDKYSNILEYPRNPKTPTKCNQYEMLESMRIYIERFGRPPVPAPVLARPSGPGRRAEKHVGDESFHLRSPRRLRCWCGLKGNGEMIWKCDFSPSWAGKKRKPK